MNYTKEIDPLFSFKDEASGLELQVFHPFFHTITYITEERGKKFAALNAPSLYDYSNNISDLFQNWVRSHTNGVYHILNYFAFSAQTNLDRIYHGDYDVTILPNPNNSSQSQAVKGLPIGIRDLFLTNGRHLTGQIKPAKPDDIKLMLGGDFDGVLRKAL